jgi:hypothetical protein
MARLINQWEAEIDPPSVHKTKAEAVTAEIAAMLGFKGKSDGDDASLAFGLAVQITTTPAAFIACLEQLLEGQP